MDTASTSGAERFGVVWPLLEFDGRTVLNNSIGTSIAATSFPPTAGAPVVLPAGKAVASDGVKIASDQSDYQGTGFATFPKTGGSLEWRGVEGGDGGPTVIGFRYSLGLGAASTRTAKVVVNGVGQPDATFLSTGAWNDWHQLYLPVTLKRGGENVIRIEFTGPDSPIIDEFRVHPAVASAPEPDQQNFIALKKTHQLDATEALVRGDGYGYMRPVQVTDSGGAPVETFVYPRSAGRPERERVRDSFVRHGQDFSSLLGRVKGNLYVGRTSAGGMGKGIDLGNDGTDDVTFDQECAFILQLKEGRVTAVEADRPVKATVAGQQLELASFTPVAVGRK